MTFIFSFGPASKINCEIFAFLYIYIKTLPFTMTCKSHRLLVILKMHNKSVWRKVSKYENIDAVSCKYGNYSNHILYGHWRNTSHAGGSGGVGSVLARSHGGLGFIARPPLNIDNYQLSPRSLKVPACCPKDYASTRTQAKLSTGEQRWVSRGSTRRTMSQLETLSSTTKCLGPPNRLHQDSLPVRQA